MPEPISTPSPAANATATATATARAPAAAASPAPAPVRPTCPRCRHTALVPSALPEGMAGTPAAQAEGPDRARTRPRALACPSCQGLWLAARTLSEALQRPPEDMAVPAHALPARQVACPSCRPQHLFEFCLPGTEVLVDGCRRCDGRWLDGAEWPRIREALVLAAQAPRHACPKCRAMQGSSTQCERCGAVFAKVLEQRQVEQAFERQAQADVSEVDVQAVFGDVAAVRIRQRVEWLEILSPFERANRYEVLLMGRRQHVACVQERSRSVLNAVLRQFLGALRPAQLELQDDRQRTVLTLDKPFRLYFHRMVVRDARSRPLGEVQRRFHPLREIYDVLDARGLLRLRIEGPLFFVPFTDPVFRFLRAGEEVGRMSKRWRGFLRERFTDADAFDASLLRLPTAADKALVFAAVFLIDYGCFEENRSGGFSVGDVT